MFVVLYVVGVVCVLGSQAVLAGAFVGIGLLARRAFGLTTLTLDDCFLAFWMGFSAIILGLILWHFVLPVTAASLVLVLLAGACGLIISRAELARVLRNEEWLSSRTWQFACVLVAAFVANQGLGGLTYDDTALYHLAAIEWNKSYALVPGLANLYGPLGFNNASLLYGALLDTGPWNDLGFRLANGLLMQAMLLRIVVALARISPAGRRADAHEVFVAALLPAAVALSLMGQLSGHSTATVAALVVLVVAERLYAMLTTAPAGAQESGYDAFTITMLSAVAVTIKVSALFFSLLAAVTALGAWWVRRKRLGGSLRRTLAWTLGGGLLLAGSWMTRGVVLSGYPLFPSKVAAMPVDWRAPEEHADAEYALAEYSSKAATMLNEVVAGRDHWGWMQRWWRVSVRAPFEFIVPFVIAGLAALVLLLQARGAEQTSRVETRGALWLLLPICVALSIWFFVAPEGRYAVGFAWALAALAVAEAWRRRIPRTSGRDSRGFLLGAAAMAVITLVVAPALAVPWDSPVFVAKAIIKQSVTVFDSRDWFKRLQPPPVDPFQTASGLVVGVPRDRCWNAPVPCTINPAATLELRHPPNLRAGFRVSGPWSMQAWPFKSRPNFLSAWRESRVR